MPSISGFDKWDRLVGRQFGQNSQNLHENYKIRILGGKTVGEHGERRQFFWKVGGSPPVPLPLGETLQFSEIEP